MLLTFLASAEPVIQDRAHTSESKENRRDEVGIKDQQEPERNKSSLRSVSMTETHYGHAGKCHHETHYVTIVL